MLHDRTLLRIVNREIPVRTDSTVRGRDEAQSPRPTGGKRAYEKPQLRAINLAAEEVLAVGCKLDGGPGGPIGASCTSSSCFAAGS